MIAKSSVGRRWGTIRSLVALVTLLCLPITSHGAVLYDSWTSNSSPTGSYVVTVQHNQDTSTWDFVFTVDPWDAEGLGLFIDLGDFDLTDTPVMTGTSWEPYLTDGRITLYDTDADTKLCGSGCNINNLNPPLADPDDEWEFVFRLGRRKYDGIQTFNFSVNDSALAGVTDSDWGLIAVRGRQVCPSGSTYPDDEDDCDFNGDKAYATGAVVPDFDEVPVPGTCFLLGLGLVLLARTRTERAHGTNK